MQYHVELHTFYKSTPFLYLKVRLFSAQHGTKDDTQACQFFAPFLSLSHSLFSLNTYKQQINKQTLYTNNKYEQSNNYTSSKFYSPFQTNYQYTQGPYVSPSTGARKVGGLASSSSSSTRSPNVSNVFSRVRKNSISASSHRHRLQRFSSSEDWDEEDVGETYAPHLISEYFKRYELMTEL